ncbi:glycosyl transferase [Hymenopellis radicata]|nr:glycosyl transferase [Hymenopellis radicata]
MNKRLRYSLGVVLVVILVCVAYHMSVPLPADVTVKVHDTLHEQVTLTVTATKTIIAWPVATEDTKRRANATFVMLTRNSDLEGAMDAIRSIEDRFNTRHGYPYVFLNDEEFSEDFKTRMSVLTGSKAQFGRIPENHWNQPEWIDEKKAEKDRWKLIAANVKYADSVAYRNMCRFNSGFFFKHELMQPYRYYWRIEPNVKFHCDIHSDPFLFMEENKKVYGFTIAVLEIVASIRTLWSTVKDFTNAHPEYVARDNSMGFISKDNGILITIAISGATLKLLIWISGEVTRIQRSSTTWTGKRWGDAPVHSIAAALFLDRDKIHFFDDIGYQHDDWTHCPTNEDVWVKGRWHSEQKNAIYSHYSGKVYERYMGPPRRDVHTGASKHALGG